MYEVESLTINESMK